MIHYCWKSQDRALYYVFINYERYGCFFSAILEVFWLLVSAIAWANIEPLY